VVEVKIVTNKYDNINSLQLGKKQDGRTKSHYFKLTNHRYHWSKEFSKNSQYLEFFAWNSIST